MRKRDITITRISSPRVLGFLNLNSKETQKQRMIDTEIKQHRQLSRIRINKRVLIVVRVRTYDQIARRCGMCRGNARMLEEDGETIKSFRG